MEIMILSNKYRRTGTSTKTRRKGRMSRNRRHGALKHHGRKEGHGDGRREGG